MKRLLFFWISLLLTGNELLAQTQLISYGSAWKFLDNGTDQGTAWRSLAFNDGTWKNGNGKFGYGVSGVTTPVSFGSSSKRKYITTYFRKIIAVTDVPNITAYSAGVLRDDGIVVYVNGVEVYRNKMPTGGINYLTRASSAEDNGTVTQTFTISKSAFVSGNNVIAVEIHQNNANTPDMAFDLQLSRVLDLTPPSAVSILRRTPTSQLTNASAVIYRVTFSEKVRGIDHTDFTVTPVSGTATGTLSNGAVAAVGTDSTVFDVTVGSVQGDGALRLDLNGSGTGITDVAGNAINSGFTSGETYVLDHTPPDALSILRQSPATQVTSDSTIKFRIGFSEKVTAVDRNDFTLTVVDGTASGVLRDTAVAAVGTTGVTYDITINAVQGTGTLRLDLNGSGTGITDVAGNAINAGFTTGETYIIEQPVQQDPPVVNSILRQTPATQLTNATTVIFRTSFSKKVRGIDHSDFTLTTVSGTAGGTLSNGAVVAVGTDSTVFDVTLSNVQGDGTLRLDLNASGTGITDVDGNAINGGFTGGDTYLLDHTPPLVQSMLRQSPATQTTSDTTLKFRITFSEKVTGVDNNDFALTQVDGTATGVLRDTAVTAVGTTGITYDITVNAVQGNGTLRLDLKGSGTGISDVVGNAINTGFTSGQTYIIQQQVPEGPPIVTSIVRQLPASEQTDTTAVTFRVNFSEKVRGVDAADFIIFTQSGNVRGTLTKVAQQAVSTSLPDAVKVVGTDSTAWDVTVRALGGNGVLRLDVKGTNTGITDAIGSALSGGFTNGQTYTVNITAPQRFQSFTDLDPLSISSATREIPQTKVWHYAGKWWAVAATSAGTKILRLDNTSWTDVLTIATATNSRSDCRVVGNLVHLLLFRGASSTSYFVSLEYDAVANTYKRWTQRTTNVNIVFESGAITATLDVDGTGRAWIASNSSGNMLVRYSDAPYSSWSAPITIATGAISEDICAVTALPGKIGVFWSNQSTRRFGFKTHTDGADPNVWSADEVPAGQSALNEGAGMADDHLNIVPASDGTLYCAVKTGYNKDGLATMALLVRRPNNTWDNLYPVTSSKEGNRPVVVVNEAAGKVKVMYVTQNTNPDGTRSGDIIYRESSTAAIAFGPPVTLISGAGNYNIGYVTSSHQTYNPSVVVWATNETVSPLRAVGVLASDETLPENFARVATSPALIPENNSNGRVLVFPNPFAASTMVNFILPNAGRYSIVLYDSKGAQIRVIRQGWSQAGVRNTVRIDGLHLAAGLYYIKVQAGGKVQTMKLLKR